MNDVFDTLSESGENIRAVIWDLDETFWAGTHTEGGISQHIAENEDLIKELSRRGIVNSICSKNDFNQVEKILKERGIWDYFVFPSIDWTHKGQRLAGIVEDLQLRPQTVLFVDDNPQNLGAAMDAVPGLNITNEKAIRSFAEHKRLQGSPDEGMTRLAQYKVLEKRKSDEDRAGGDKAAFLRTCDIKVTIIHDVPANIDRAVELVNRTNQLNFTKIRLPEYKKEANDILLNEVKQFYVWSGLVHVEDKYGDYGIVGFYLGSGIEDRTLKHFCFSCRTLGMDVETYIYRELGRPNFTQSGEVLVDLSSNHEIDWINMSSDSGFEAGGGQDPLPEIRLRGGCDLDAMLHYFGTNTRKLIETNIAINGLFLRRDTSATVASFANSYDEKFLAALTRAGIDKSIAEFNIFNQCAPGTLLILSMWGDAYIHHYRHKETGKIFGISLDIADQSSAFASLQKDTNADISRHVDHIQDEVVRSATEKLVRELAEHFENIYELGFDEQISLASKLIDMAPQGSRVAVILPPLRHHGTGEYIEHPPLMRVREGIKEAASSRPYVRAIDIEDCISDDNEVQPHWHFDRLVYYRLYKKILGDINSAQQSNWALKFDC